MSDYILQDDFQEFMPMESLAAMTDSAWVSSDDSQHNAVFQSAPEPAYTSDYQLEKGFQEPTTQGSVTTLTDWTWNLPNTSQHNITSQMALEPAYACAPYTEYQLYTGNVSQKKPYIEDTLQPDHGDVQNYRPCEVDKRVIHSTPYAEYTSHTQYINHTEYTPRAEYQLYIENVPQSEQYVENTLHTKSPYYCDVQNHRPCEAVGGVIPYITAEGRHMYTSNQREQAPMSYISSQSYNAIGSSMQNSSLPERILNDNKNNPNRRCESRDSGYISSTPSPIIIDYQQLPQTSNAFYRLPSQLSIAATAASSGVKRHIAVSKVNAVPEVASFASSDSVFADKNAPATQQSINKNNLNQCIFEEVLSRLCMKNYKITAGEVKRRICGPEEMNISTLNSYLRRGKGGGSSQELNIKLEQVGIHLPKGKRKNSTFFTALAEDECLEMVVDLDDLMQFFPLHDLAAVIRNELYDKNYSPLKFLKEFLCIAVRILSNYDPNVGCLEEAKQIPVNSLSTGLREFSNVTHGFGTKCMIIVLKTFIRLIDRNFAISMAFQKKSLRCNDINYGKVEQRGAKRRHNGDQLSDDTSSNVLPVKVVHSRLGLLEALYCIVRPSEISRRLETEEMNSSTLTSLLRESKGKAENEKLRLYLNANRIQVKSGQRMKVRSMFTELAEDDLLRLAADYNQLLENSDYFPLSEVSQKVIPNENEQRYDYVGKFLSSAFNLLQQVDPAVGCLNVGEHTTAADPLSIAFQKFSDMTHGFGARCMLVMLKTLLNISMLAANPMKQPTIVLLPFSKEILRQYMAALENRISIAAPRATRRDI